MDFDVWVGYIMMVPWTFAPRGSTFCNGQTLPIAQYQALFALIGSTFGGDGKTTFGLPDLRGRMPVGVGQGQGLTPREFGRNYGAEKIGMTVSANNLAPHAHTLTASATAADLTQSPAAGWTLGAAAAVSTATTPVQMYAASPLPAVPISTVPSAPTSSAGGTGEPVDVPTLAPALCLNFIIALQGVFPVRS